MSRLRSFSALVGFVVMIAVAASGSAVAKTTHPGRAQVVVPHGQALQIAVAVDDTGAGASFAPSVRQAVQWAIDGQHGIRGFAIQVNAFSQPCDGGSPASLAANAATANAVVSNGQNVGVIGHFCSPEAPAWLPVYEAAGVVTINGSTTGPYVPPFGPTVFNATTIPDPEFTDTWYPAVIALPSDVLWRARFQARFGSPPTDIADLYYDATNVLLAALRKTSRIVHGKLVIDRAALAATVRHTHGFRGVTCTVTLDPTTGYRVNDPAALARCAHKK